MIADLLVQKTATLSDCGEYRYRLTRRWSDGPLLPFIMLNPSTADADVDDPTIRRCMGFARREGASGIVVGNLYAYRATSPKKMLAADNPYGPNNFEALQTIIDEADTLPIVCAWGANANGEYGRHFIARVKKAGRTAAHLGRTNSGAPKHPLYIAAAQPLELFQ